MINFIIRLIAIFFIFESAFDWKNSVACMISIVIYGIICYNEGKRDAQS